MQNRRERREGRLGYESTDQRLGDDIAISRRSPNRDGDRRKESAFMANPPHKDPPRPPRYDPVTKLNLPNYNVASLNGWPETRTAYLRGELAMRQVRTELENDGVSTLEGRARTLSALRNALRSWTRDLMHNRDDAQRLIAKEQNKSFGALVARAIDEKGLSGDAIYDDIIETSTQSRPEINGEINRDDPPALPPVWPSFPIWGQPNPPPTPPPAPPPPPPRKPPGGTHYI